MRKTAIAVAVMLILANVATAQQKQAVRSKPGAPPLEAKVRNLWEAFQKKDKAKLASLLDDRFRMFEEGTSSFGDKKAEVNAVDDFELVNYTLSDFTVTPLGPDSALVTYIAQYEGKSGGQSSKAKSVFAEVWTHTGNDWKNRYLQETYVK
ncbi:MAG TPA: nuclear transport factor 2 family protein [Candidatus Sulfotelmatobacter sp.]|nr:nuclear transport factor 2 family protein [Candidatus Sulfotelmatobacter sp.]